MNLFFRLSAMIVYLYGIYYVLGKDFNTFFSPIDLISLLLGTILFFFTFYMKKENRSQYKEFFKKSFFWSGFFISIIHLLSLFENYSVYKFINRDNGLVLIILIQCRPVLYAISISILLYSRSVINYKEDIGGNNNKIHELTTRENEIALMVAQGKTNNEIAEKLFISPFTVKKHLYNIFTKLQISQRSEIKHIISTEKTTN